MTLHENKRYIRISLLRCYLPLVVYNIKRIMFVAATTSRIRLIGDVGSAIHYSVVMLIEGETVEFCYSVSLVLNGYVVHPMLKQRKHRACGCIADL